jgi:hypothetical protein
MIANSLLNITISVRRQRGGKGVIEDNVDSYHHFIVRVDSPTKQRHSKEITETAEVQVAERQTHWEKQNLPHYKTQ